MSAWTKEEEDQLRTLNAQGFSGGRLAQELHKTTNAIAGKIFRLGLSKKAAGIQTLVCLNGGRPPGLRSDAPNKPLPPSVDSLYPATSSGPVTLMELISEHCRWPLDQLSPQGELLYCGRVRAYDHRSYCPFHRNWSSRSYVNAHRATKSV